MNHRTPLRALACAAPLLLWAAPVRAQSSALLADGRTLENVEIKAGSQPDHVALTRKGREVATVALRDLLVVDFGKVPGRELTPTVRFVNGSQVHGKVTLTAPRHARIAAGWGSFTVPLTACAALRLDATVALPDAPPRDTIVLAADRVEGDIGSVAGTKLSINLGGKPFPVETRLIKALAFAPRPQAAEEAPAGELTVAVDLGGGERLSGKWLKLGEDLLSLRMSWGETVDIPTASISRLEVKNGRLVFLSDLKPTEARQIPYLDRGAPHRVDRSVAGRPMRLDGKLYARGIGVHSRSDITYTLDGTFKTFAAMLGIDDAVAGAGSVVFRVFGDEKLLFESPTVRGGDPPIPLKLEMKGVLLLRLEVDYAENGDAGDHANWADAQLLRQ